MNTTKEQAMTEEPSRTTGPERREGALLRPAMWLLLAVSLVGNAATSGLASATVLHLAFGAVTLIAATVLAVHHYRHRR
jgi:hypothetical protein